MKVLPLFLGLSASLSGLQALDLTVESFRDGAIPIGYSDVSGGIDEAQTVNVSAEPFVDYLIPNNSGSPGITAQKAGGSYLVDSTVAELSGGANKLTNPDKFQVVFAWQDGTPLPFGSDYYGVSWGGFSASESVTLTTRIDLASEDPLRIYHWFNDGWDYTNHVFLDGHQLRVRHYDAQGNVLAELEEVLPSGGSEELFGDARQFYTATIDVKRGAPGEFVLIEQEAANIGYKGTAIALRQEEPEPDGWLIEVGQSNEDRLLGVTYGLDDGFARSSVLGFFSYPTEPWLYQPHYGWLVIPEQPGRDISVGGVFYFSPDYGYLFVHADAQGWFYSYRYDVWDHFLDPTNALPRS